MKAIGDAETPAWKARAVLDSPLTHPFPAKRISVRVTTRAHPQQKLPEQLVQLLVLHPAPVQSLAAKFAGLGGSGLAGRVRAPEPLHRATGGADLDHEIASAPI